MMQHLYKFYLYVVGQAAEKDAPIVKNVRDSLRVMFGNDYSLDVVDVVKNPQSAVDQGILFTPTLMKMVPEPKKRVVGNFLDKTKTIEALKLIQAVP